MMRVLATIPHFHARHEKPQRVFGSVTEDAMTRARALGRCIDGLRALARQSYTYHIYRGGDRHDRIDTEQVSDMRMDVVVCTFQEKHVLDLLDRGRESFKQVHVMTDDPMYLGVGCHNYLYKYIDDYDYFCFLEDDLIIHDPLWFFKLEWFNRITDDDALLQPHRYERKRGDGARKYIVDTQFEYHQLGENLKRLYYNYDHHSPITAELFGRNIRFERAGNPHSGCFFLNQAQMRRVARQPFFGKQSDAFVGPLETSATLGIMTSFRVYKPSVRDFGFLELEHAGDRIVTEYYETLPNLGRAA